MRIPAYILVFISLAQSLIIMAQPIHIQVDKVALDDPLTVKFSYSPVTASSVLWEFGDGKMDRTISPVHTFEKAGNYTVKLRINNMDTTQVDIQVEGLSDTKGLLATRQMSDTTIVVPNVFTPNGDNINDEFNIWSNGKYFLSLKVFTKSGVLIYKCLSKSIIWDGRLDSGEKVLPGIYYYIIEMTDSAIPVKKTGFVYIFE